MRLMRCAVTILILLSIGCVSAPRGPVDPASAELRLVTQKEIEIKYGSSYEQNPFVPPSALITGQPKDYALLELRYTISAPARVEVDAHITGLTGKQSEIMDKRRLSEYLDNFRLGTGAETVRSKILDRYCLPSAVYNANRGDHFFYVVVVCQHPYPQGARIVARVYINGEELASLDQELPAL